MGAGRICRRRVPNVLVFSQANDRNFIEIMEFDNSMVTAL
jgi:hypothetical protein